MTIWICRWQMSTLVTSQYQPRLSSVTKIFSRPISQSDWNIQIKLYHIIDNRILQLIVRSIRKERLPLLPHVFIKLVWRYNSKETKRYHYWSLEENQSNHTISFSRFAGPNPPLNFLHKFIWFTEMVKFYHRATEIRESAEKSHPCCIL